MSPADRPTLTVAETAELLGISRWLVQQAVQQGALPSVRLGRRILIPKARLQAWLEGERSEPGVGLMAVPDEAHRHAATVITASVPRARAQ